MIMIGLLSAIAVPAYLNFVTKARLARMIKNLEGFQKQFNFYRLEHGNYPDDSHIVLTAGMEGRISDAVWLADTQIGGNYN